MTDSNATDTRNINVDFPDFPDEVITFSLLTFFAANGNEGFPQKEHTLTLSATGTGTQALPVPSSDAWLWEIGLPDGNKPKATLAAGADLQLTAWLASALSTETANSLEDYFLLLAGGTMTGAVTLASMTTAERDALTPAEGMAIYNETTATVQVYQGAAWVSVGSGSGGGGVTSVFGRTGIVVAAASDYDANQVDVTPAGNIAATDVQAALEELDSEKSATGHTHSYLANVVEDTTPQLGGNLDLNGNVITGLEIGTDVQAQDAGLTDIAGLAVTDGNIIVGDGANWVAESGATARTSLGAADTAAHLIVAASDETTDLTTGTAKVTFRMPFAMTLTEVRANVNTAPAGSAIQVDINEGGVSILSTEITIDAGDETSEDATTPPVISDTALADDAEITIDIDAVGSSTAGTGLKVALIGTRP